MVIIYINQEEEDGHLLANFFDPQWCFLSLKVFLEVFGINLLQDWNALRLDILCLN